MQAKGLRYEKPPADLFTALKPGAGRFSSVRLQADRTAMDI
jgi:hypothetical protein